MKKVLTFLRNRHFIVKIATVYEQAWYIVFHENKIAAGKFLTFCGLRTRKNTFFAHSPLSKQHLALTMAIAMCLCQSAASPKHKNSAKVTVLFWLHSRNGWSILSVSGMGNCSHPMGKKDISLRAIAQNPTRYSQENWSVSTRLNLQ